MSYLSIFRNQIESTMVHYRSNDKLLKFLPDSAVDQLLTLGVLKSILLSVSPPLSEVERSILADKVFNASAKKIVFVLVLIGQLDNLPSILDAGITDHQLPTYLPIIQSCGHFLNVQWQVIAPTFHRGMHASFSESRVLPYINESCLQVPASGYGMVKKAELHYAHHTLAEWYCDSKANCIIAIKSLVHDHAVPENVLEREFERERHILEHLNNLKHLSIIELLCTYQHGTAFSYVFPFAELDLARFLTLSRDERPHLLQNDRDVYWAMYGLAHALKAMHEYAFTDTGGEVRKGIYHHDLHPANIVVRGKVFLIADFGTASFCPSRNSQGQDWSSRALCRWTTGTETYGPPEIDPEPRKQEIDPFAVDLWSFACILLEVIVYNRHGKSALCAFREQRNTWVGRSRDECFHRAFALKAEVVKQLDVTEASVSGCIPEDSLLSICRSLLNPTHPTERRKVNVPEQILQALKYCPTPPSRPLLLAEERLKQQREKYPFHYAVHVAGEVYLWERDKQRGYDLYHADAENRLPIHWASTSSSSSLTRVNSIPPFLRFESIEVALPAKTQNCQTLLHAKDDLGDTPLSLAIQYHNFVHANCLGELDHGSIGLNGTNAVAQYNNYCKTPLHLAVETRVSSFTADIINYIKRRGSDDDSLKALLLFKDIKGRIPLHYAAESPFSSAHLTLLNAMPTLRDAMLDNTDDLGRTPIDLAREAGFTHFARSNFDGV